MRHAISWADLRGAQVGVWGLGVEGEASVRKLRDLGAHIVLVDDHKTSFDGHDVLPTDQGGLEALRACEVVVKAPGISRRQPRVEALETSGIPVLGGIGLWMQEAPRDRVVAITGTKGKSTTSAMVGHLLNRLGHATFVGGNIGRPPFDPKLADPAMEFWVIEVSSFQATDLAVSPPVVVVTSLHPDHLDWHGSVENYYADKLSLCHQSGAEQTIASASSPTLVARGALLGPTVDWVYPDVGRRQSWHHELGVRGDHNLDNAEMAARVIGALGIEASDVDLADAARSYAGLEHRLQTVRLVDGVEYVDDSLSTNVLPTLRAIEAFATQRTAVIVGGFDRGIDYASLGHGLANRAVPLLVVTIPPSGPRIGEALAATLLPDCVETVAAADLADAVATAHRWAQPDGVVLLSPAAPSFGVYRDYRDRAAAFVAAIDAVASPG